MLIQHRYLKIIVYVGDRASVRVEVNRVRPDGQTFIRNESRAQRDVIVVLICPAHRAADLSAVNSQFDSRSESPRFRFAPWR